MSMTLLRPHRHQPGGRRLHQRHCEHEERPERPERPERCLGRHPAARPQQADPEESKQEDSELQG